MRFKSGFVIRKVCGHQVVAAEGLQHLNFNKLLVLNDTATFLWKAVEGKDFTVQDMADALVEEYGIDAELATKDAQSLADSWKAAGVLEEETA